MSLSVENVEVEQLTHSAYHSTALFLLHEVFHNTQKNYFQEKIKECINDILIAKFYHFKQNILVQIYLYIWRIKMNLL